MDILVLKMSKMKEEKDKNGSQHQINRLYQKIDFMLQNKTYIISLN